MYMPVGVIMPNMIQKMPPIMGSGMVTNRAPNLENIPNTSIIIAAACITLLLPTF